MALLFAQLSGQIGLRGIIAGMASQSKKLYHLGVREICRSTLSYANNHRPHELFQKLFNSLLHKVSLKAPKHKFRFNNPLFSMDSTIIDLCTGLYDWAKFRKTKAGLKLSVKLNYSGYLPNVVVQSDGKRNDIKAGWNINFQKDDIVVFDRGYNDYKLFETYCNEGVYFVTRLKRNAQFKVIERKDVTKYKHISSDQIIMLTGFYARKNCCTRPRYSNPTSCIKIFQKNSLKNPNLPHSAIIPS